MYKNVYSYYKIYNIILNRLMTTFIMFLLIKSLKMYINFIEYQIFLVTILAIDADTSRSVMDRIDNVQIMLLRSCKI